tara:strand:+ start:1252 stop:3618 length:2367 start_codon:yes stop_codon:yes gene_type:complete
MILNKKSYVLIFVLIISLNNYAQNNQLNNCLTLDELDEKYKIGRFEEVNDILRDCIKAYKENDVSYERALRIKAKNLIAMDSMKLAREVATELLNFKPNYTQQSGDPYLLVELIKSLKVKGATVSSVSKFEESLGEAPATVILVTEDEIIDRGYNDLEALLHDLPGFDITRSVGILYSHIYQRGYRADNTSRMLYVVDGIEQNDLWGNLVYLSRQYPISNIKSVEVVYGPASTIYGANAYLGVVSVITKNANDFFVGDKKNNTVATNAMISYGTYNTTTADVTTVFRSKNKGLSAMFTARYFESDEQDLSGFDDYDYNIDGVPTQVTDTLQYFNRSESIYLGSKIESQNFTMGFGYWFKKEGIGGWAGEQLFAAAPYSVWNPYNAFIYGKYEKPLGTKEKLFFSNFTRYRISGLDDSTQLWPIPALDDITGDYVPRSPKIYDLHSAQLRNETQLLYKANSRFSIISGLEFRFSQIQGDYARPSEPLNYRKYITLDAGLYSQSAYQVIDKKLKFTFGGRLDYNKVRNSNSGYGVVFNPRLALVYTPKNTFVKLIYSEAFMNPTNFQKYSLTGTRATPNVDLLTEKVKNYEFSFRRDFMKNKLFAEIVLYSSYYSNIVNEVPFATNTNSDATQFQNTGERSIYGAQANVNYKDKQLRLYLNYTFTNPTDTDLLGEERRIADIASHQLNFGGNYKFNNGLNINLRTNFIGDREVGQGTTVPANTAIFPPYFLLNATIGYKFFKEKFNFQYTVNNILDHQHYSPGIRSTGSWYTKKIPQFGRNMQFRLSFSF